MKYLYRQTMVNYMATITHMLDEWRGVASHECIEHLWFLAWIIQDAHSNGAAKKYHSTDGV
jgi:hypothetical protein